jgi:hypothetical protein
MSLYGIETEADCRMRTTEILELHRDAEQAFNLNRRSERTKQLIADLKNCLATLYKKRTHSNDPQMSDVERECFFPAIHRAYVDAPNLAAPKTWEEGLSKIEDALKEYGLPKDKKKSK